MANDNPEDGWSGPLITHLPEDCYDQTPWPMFFPFTRASDSSN